MLTARTDETIQMLRLIRVFTGRIGHFVGFVMLWLKLSADPCEKGTYHIGEQGRLICTVSSEPSLFAHTIYLHFHCNRLR